MFEEDYYSPKKKTYCNNKSGNQGNFFENFLQFTSKQNSTKSVKKIYGKAFNQTSMNLANEETSNVLLNSCLRMDDSNPRISLQFCSLTLP